MEKYSQLRDLVSKLEGLELVEAPAVTDTQILYAHDPSYLIKILSGNLSAKEQQRLASLGARRWWSDHAALQALLLPLLRRH